MEYVIRFNQDDERWFIIIKLEGSHEEFGRVYCKSLNEVMEAFHMLTGSGFCSPADDCQGVGNETKTIRETA